MIVKYSTGIIILIVVGLTGGDIIWASIQIGVIYGAIEWIDDRSPPPSGGT